MLIGQLLVIAIALLLNIREDIRLSIETAGFPFKRILSQVNRAQGHEEQGSQGISATQNFRKQSYETVILEQPLRTARPQTKAYVNAERHKLRQSEIVEPNGDPDKIPNFSFGLDKDELSTKTNDHLFDQTTSLSINTYYRFIRRRIEFVVQRVGTVLAWSNTSKLRREAPRGSSRPRQKAIIQSRYLSRIIEARKRERLFNRKIQKLESRIMKTRKALPLPVILETVEYS